MTHWTESAACRGITTNLFYPPSETARHQAQIERAKSVCAACPVSQACLSEAMAQESSGGYRAGIWAGLTPTERESLARVRR